VEGRIQYRSYDDKQGAKKYVTEIVLDELVMLDSRKSDAPEATVEVPTGAPSKDDDSSLPF